ncbi:MAG: response regulator [Chroococcidiopsidaceae cyanobacterium CP_BM_ER_R8_30]|nr:response regulator [Chroococcidiopsidaceae cyanobacterium CP_BM_ER_R8_30]
MDMASTSGNDCQDIIVRPLVLTVDDNEDNLALLNQVLIIIGCSFVSSKDGHSAILVAQKYQPDLILLDIMLPDLDGMEVVRQLKQDPKTRQIPIVAVTAMARTEDHDRILAVGCDGYIKKPYMIDELEATIRRFLFGV